MTFIDEIRTAAIVNIDQQEVLEEISRYVPEDEISWIKLTGKNPNTVEEAVDLLVKAYSAPPPVDPGIEIDGGNPFEE